MNLIIPLLLLSPVVVIISRNNEFLSVGCVTELSRELPCYFVFFNAKNEPVFPTKDKFHANFTNILSRGGVDKEYIFSTSVGSTRILVYP